MEELVITSMKNPRVKHLLALQEKSSLRRKEGLFVVEGRRELEHCLEGGFEVESVFVNEELRGKNEGFGGKNEGFGGQNEGFGGKNEGFGGKVSFTVAPQVYEKMAYRGSTEGIIAIVRTKERRLADLRLPPNPLIMVLESVEKPGNLGAVLRSADAARADAVVVCDALTDLYNPNLIRSSIGAVFTVPTVACSSAECIAFLREHGISILTAQLQDSRLYYDTPMSGPTAIVMGTESTGLTSQWREAATAHIRIPMLGRLDSLNVSVSAAILLFEAVRQRQTTC